MALMAGKHALMQMLRAEGVRYIFGNPGTSESPLLDALESYPDLEYVLVLQESVAIGMADTYARATGEVGFVSLHIDNGLANGFALLVDSKSAGTPLVVTAGNKDVRKLAEGRSDLARMAEPFTKWSAEITHPEQYPSVMRRAFNEARTPPTGPVFVAFSGNSLDTVADVEIVPSKRMRASPGPDSEDVVEAVAVLAEAERPVMVVGDRLGQYGGTAEAVRVAELTGAAVYGLQSAQVNFPTGHPQYMGSLSLRQPAAREAFRRSDVVLAVGAPVFSDFFYQPGAVLRPETKLIHIDINPGEIGKSEPTTLGILASPKPALAEIAAGLEGAMSGVQREAAKGRAAALAAATSAVREKFRQLVKSQRDASPMTAAAMLSALAEAMPEDALVFDDAISSKGPLHEAMKFDEPGAMFGQRGGSIGWGIGAGMGLKLARPDRPVVAVVGDGSAMMTAQGFWTAVNSDIPVVYVICNNASYRILKLNMGVYMSSVIKEPERKSKHIAMDFPAPFDMAAIASAFGLWSRRVERPEQVGPTLREALASGRPAVLDMIIDGSV